MFRGHDENRAGREVKQAVRHAAEKKSADRRQTTGSQHDQISAHFLRHIHNLVCGPSSHVAPNDQRGAESFLRELGRQLLKSRLEFRLVRTARYSDRSATLDSFHDVHDRNGGPAFSR
jgi:hypothetical protein